MNRTLFELIFSAYCNERGMPISTACTESVGLRFDLLVSTYDIPFEKAVLDLANITATAMESCPLKDSLESSRVKARKATVNHG